VSRGSFYGKAVQTHSQSLLVHGRFKKKSCAAPIARKIFDVVITPQ
jgi:hypothetical protein